RGNVLFRGRLRPTTGLGIIDSDPISFQKHPAQHVLRLRIALLGRRSIEHSCASVVLLDSLSFEIEGRQVALAYRVAAFGCQQKPALGKLGVASDPKPFGKAGSDIGLRT